MRSFSCGRCGQLLFFENNRCLRCSSRVAFSPRAQDMVVHDPLTGPPYTCANVDVAGCNWLVEDGPAGTLCRSCRLTRTRPSDDDAEGLASFAVAEAAKRRALCQLLDLDLPFGALRFDLLSSRAGPVVTGHAAGLVTIDLAESDDVRREQRRAELGEPYRTLLGHFRHETGHFYWQSLVASTASLATWRQLFGDERRDYEAALGRHYEEGPPAGWSASHVSAYATAHPWEDWAETFAHYLHIRDTLQTASAFGMIVTGPGPLFEPSLIAVPGEETGDFGSVVAQWLPLTYALNAVSRSMGRDDLYPFVLAPAVVEKLAFVHERVAAVSRPPR